MSTLLPNSPAPHSPPTSVPSSQLPLEPHAFSFAPNPLTSLVYFRVLGTVSSHSLRLAQFYHLFLRSWPLCCFYFFYFRLPVNFAAILSSTTLTANTHSKLSAQFGSHPSALFHFEAQPRSILASEPSPAHSSPSNSAQTCQIQPHPIPPV
jgi:hypothetical protein